MAFGPHNEILRPFGDKHVICTKFDDPQAIILTLHSVCALKSEKSAFILVAILRKSSGYSVCSWYYIYFSP